MPNLNIEIEEELLWRFRQLKIKLKTGFNAKTLEKIIELAEKYV